MRPLTFTLSEIQLRSVKAAFAKLEGAPRARVTWFDNYSLCGNVLSIHVLDLISILSFCQRDPHSEMELFRIRKVAKHELTLRLNRTQNHIKRQNIRLWLDNLEALGPGSDSEREFASAPSGINKIELLT